MKSCQRSLLDMLKSNDAKITLFEKKTLSHLDLERHRRLYSDIEQVIDLRGDLKRRMAIDQQTCGETLAKVWGDFGNSVGKL